MVGKQLAQYRIVGEIGRGGMGVVYKAEDTRLHRTVALKLLPIAALGNEDDRARFFREAQAAAQLQHTNIATVYAIEEAAAGDEESRPFIAMEYVDGETLTERITRGPLKLKEVVQIATQIALALEVAHEKNIVHRDVKSGNVMLTRRGEVKVLDFGLAKTAQSTRLTRLGSTLGTIAYMSPEQARGEEVDRRSDIWSLGVLIYEMIAGRLPFTSEYEQAAVYSILNEEPEPLTSVRTGVPMALEWIVSKLIAKNAADRYQNVSDLLVDLRTVDLESEGMTRVSKPSMRSPQPATPPRTALSRGRIIGHAAAAALGAALVLLAWMLWPTAQAPGDDKPTLRFTHALSTSRLPTVLDVSDNGTKVAYHLDVVHVLDLTTGESYELPGTENTTVVEFSPDGEWLLLTKTVSIDRVPVRGGTPVSIVGTTEGGPRANWGPDGWIVFEDLQNVYRYSESRNELIQVSSIDTTAGEQDVDWPSLLPNGRTVMGTLEHRFSPPQVRFWDFETGRVLGTVNFAAYRVRYLPSGHLAGIVEGEGLVVVPFDLKRLEITGPRIPVIPNVAASHFSVSGTGTLVYVSNTGTAEELVRSVPAVLRFPRFKRRLPIEPGFYTNVELSPDEHKLVYMKVESAAGGGSIWVMDLETEVSKPITSTSLQRIGAVTWMPGSDSVAYTRRSIPSGPHSIYVRAVDGSGQERRVMTGGNHFGELDVSPDGNWIAYVASVGPGLGLLRLYDVRSGEEREIAGLDAASNILNPQISSDSRFIAYKQDESVFVRPLDGSGVPRNMSKGFAQRPRWTGDRTYFFTLTVGGAVQKWPLDAGEGFSVSRGWSQPAIIGDVVPYFDIFDDGERAIVPDVVDEPADSDSLAAPSVPMNFVINWVEELR